MGAIDAPILCSERGTLRDSMAEPARLQVEGCPVVKKLAPSRSSVGYPR